MYNCINNCACLIIEFEGDNRKVIFSRGRDLFHQDEWLIYFQWSWLHCNLIKFEITTTLTVLIASSCCCCCCCCCLMWCDAVWSQLSEDRRKMRGIACNCLPILAWQRPKARAGLGTVGGSKILKTERTTWSQS